MRHLNICNRLLWTFFFITIPLGVANANPVTIAFSFNSEPFSFNFGNESTIQSGCFSYDDSNPISVFNGIGFLLTDFELDALSFDPARDAFWVPAPDFDNTTIETNGGIDDQWALFDQSGMLRFQQFANPDGQGGFTGSIVNLSAVSVPVFYSPSCVISAEIDIKPGSFPSSWPCEKIDDGIPVAILSTDTFDATTVHADTVFFGTTNTATDEVHKKDGKAKRHVEDVNKDGLPDMVFHFRFGDTGFSCADIPDTENSVDLTGILTGATNDGTAIQGQDTLRLVRK